MKWCSEDRSLELLKVLRLPHCLMCFSEVIGKYCICDFQGFLKRLKSRTSGPLLQGSRETAAQAGVPPGEIQRRQDDRDDRKGKREEWVAQLLSVHVGSRSSQLCVSWASVYSSKNGGLAQKILLAIFIVRKQDSKQDCKRRFVENAFRFFLSNYKAVYKQIWSKLRSFQISHPISHFIVSSLFSILFFLPRNDHIILATIITQSGDTGWRYGLRDSEINSYSSGHLVFEKRRTTHTGKRTASYKDCWGLGIHA